MAPPGGKGLLMICDYGADLRGELLEKLKLGRGGNLRREVILGWEGGSCSCARLVKAL